MNGYQLAILALIGVALASWMMISGVGGIVFVAMLGAALTVGLTTGSLAPIYPSVSRSTAPRKFWLVMFGCAVVIAGNVLNLFLRS